VSEYSYEQQRPDAPARSGYVEGYDQEEAQVVPARATGRPRTPAVPAPTPAAAPAVPAPANLAPPGQAARPATGFFAGRVLPPAPQPGVGRPPAQGPPPGAAGYFAGRVLPRLPVLPLPQPPAPQGLVPPAPLPAARPGRGPRWPVLRRGGRLPPAPEPATAVPRHLAGWSLPPAPSGRVSHGEARAQVVAERSRSQRQSELKGMFKRRRPSDARPPSTQALQTFAQRLREVRAPTVDSAGNPLDWAWDTGSWAMTRPDPTKPWEPTWSAPAQGPDGQRPPPATKARLGRYRDEEVKAGPVDGGTVWRNKGEAASPESDRYVTRYGQTDAERSRNNYVPDDDGLLRNAQGAPLDTRGDRQGFALAADGTVRQFDAGVQITDQHGGSRDVRTADEIPAALGVPANRLFSQHHTTPVSGHPVGAAGSQSAVGGVPVNIRDDSGHYHPEAEYTHQYVRSLADAGNPLEYDLGTGPQPSTVTLIGAKGAAGSKSWVKQNPAYYQQELTLTADQFLATRGNERQARLKKSMLADLLQKVERVD